MKELKKDTEKDFKDHKPPSLWKKFFHFILTNKDFHLYRRKICVQDAT